MILAVDIGNSNICIGGLDGMKVLFTARMVTRPRCTEDEYTAELKFLLGRLGVTPEACEGVIVCSVVPDLTKVLADACTRLTGRKAMLVSPALNTGLTFAVDARTAWAGPHSPMPPPQPPTIPALHDGGLGTATTYNVISSKRAFLGGFILPGVQTSLRAISSGTAQLPPISPETPDHLIGRNTVECLNNGVMFGTAAMLDGLAARVKPNLAAADRGCHRRPGPASCPAAPAR
ncbi:MAG: type III pantothenate kinase [Gemmiger sp.]